MEDVLNAQQAPIEQAQPTLTQDQVNKIVAREKAKAAEAGRREAEEQFRGQISQQQEQRNANVPRDADVSAIYDQVQQRFNQEQERLQRELEDRKLKEHMNQVANNYLSKVDAAKSSYQDYDEVIKDFDPSAFPQLVYLLSGMENAGHVLYDLSKNPLKLAAVDRLAERNPRQAQSELTKLAASISTNMAAQADAQKYQTSEPLDKMSPSSVSGNNGKSTIGDLRSQNWLKG